MSVGPKVKSGILTRRGNLDNNIHIYEQTQGEGPSTNQGKRSGTDPSFTSLKNQNDSTYIWILNFKPLELKIYVYYLSSWSVVLC